MKTSKPATSAADVSAAPAERPSGSALETLRREIEGLGLSPYEARVLLALLQLGSCTTLQLARVAGVPRTSTYQVLEELHAKRLAHRVPGEGPAVWASASRDEVLDRLHAVQEEQLRLHRERTARVRQMLAEAIPDSPSAPLPNANLIYGATAVKAAYEQLFADATGEVLVFNRPPYSWDPAAVNPLVVEQGHRVPTRVLYQAAQLAAPGAEAFRRAMEAYHEAGVDGRVVDELPLKLAVFDRKAALVTMTDPKPPEVGFPTALLIEHEGFASVLADAFEHRWSTARPYAAFLQELEDAASS